MYKSEKDLRLFLSQSQETELKDITHLLAAVESKLEHSPDEIPLDIFLDWSQFVHRWYWLITVNLRVDGFCSYNQIKKLTTDLRTWKDEFVKKDSDTCHDASVLLIKATQKAINLFVNITVESVEEK